METTPNLLLPYIMPSQAQKHVTHNEALRALDAVVQLAVLDRDLAAPPALPSEGDRHIVAAEATGAWTGQGGRIAAWQDGGWAFLDPRPGWLCFVAEESALLFWTGASWENAAATLPDLQNLSLLGVGTAADTENRFAAKLNKALWAALAAGEGGSGDLRYVMNKEAPANVLSLLMQSGWSGRAEIGLVGDDDLAIKVSADGSTWTEALRIARASGTVSLPASNLLTDFAVSLLPDSGRFDGGASKTQFASAFAFPSYLVRNNGTTLANGGKYISDNSDYGGAAGMLPPAIRNLIDKIRTTTQRRYGVEFFAAEATMGAQTTNAFTVGSTTYYLSLSQAFGPRAPGMTWHMYIRALDHDVVWRRFGTQRIFRDGVEMMTGHPVISPGDGWVSIAVRDATDPYLGSGYSPVQCMIYARAQNHRYLIACPALMGGITRIDPNVGIIAGINRWLE